MLLYVHIENPQGLLGTGSPGRPPRLSHSHSPSALFSVVIVGCPHWETTRLIRDVKPRTATSTFTFTQPLSSVQCCNNLYVHTEKPQDLLGTWSPGRPPRLSHSHGPWALKSGWPFRPLSVTFSAVSSAPSTRRKNVVNTCMEFVLWYLWYISGIYLVYLWYIWVVTHED